jgi:cysteinyl-tRNA synthetase
MKYLGPQIDIHIGGVDLMFPHHENEIAQSEAATGRQFARFFLHNEHLLVDGKKMSKSLGNFYTLRDLISRGFNPLAFRYLCLQSHYRSKMNFSFAALRAAENTLNELYKLGQRVKNDKYFHTSMYGSKLTKIAKEVEEALDNDLDTPKALAMLHQANNYRLWEYFEPVLGLRLSGIRNKELGIRDEVKGLIKQREQLRTERKFGKADKIRKKIKDLGYEIEDTEKGPRIIKT